MTSKDMNMKDTHDRDTADFATQEPSFKPISLFSAKYLEEIERVKRYYDEKPSLTQALRRSDN